jgi:FMN phosphatase YigB (HAD superfamily)
MSTIKVVLFDIGNVIVRATHRITDAILAEHSLRPDLWPFFYHGQHYADFSRGRISGHEFTQQICRIMNQNVPVRIAHDAHIYMVDDSALLVVQDLHERSVPLGFVTTSNQWQSERVSTLVDLEEYGQIVDSWKRGMVKTDDGAWDDIIASLEFNDIPRNEILFIDDSRANLDAAASAGLQVHHYDPGSEECIDELRRDLESNNLL